MSPSPGVVPFPTALPPCTSNAMVPTNVIMGGSHDDFSAERPGVDRTSFSFMLVSSLTSLRPARPGSEPELHAQQQPGLEATRAATAEKLFHQRIHEIGRAHV